MSRNHTVQNIPAESLPTVPSSTWVVTSAPAQSIGGAKHDEGFAGVPDHIPSHEDQSAYCADWYTDWIQSLPRLVDNPELRTSDLCCKQQLDLFADDRTNEEAVHAR